MPPLPRSRDASSFALTFAFLLWLVASPAVAELPPEAWRDDADLHAVHFVGRTIGWVVGDHGAALRSTDAGRTWEPRPVARDVSLRAVFFLTDSVGWVAGGTTVPFTQVEPGIVFKTVDAGVTWQPMNVGPLPRIHALRFFDQDHGIAAGAGSPEFPSGVFSTEDGGKTWNALQIGTVVNPAGWRAAAFPAPGRGAVVGSRTRRAVVNEQGLLPSRGWTTGLRGLNAVAFGSVNEGWAAGDGGTLLHTINGGLVWQDAVAALPQQSRDLFDLQAVATVDKSVWAAGRPGGIVWHSSDGGREWRGQPTGSPLPIHALHFASQSDGVAVGAMGLILRTSDGGTTWQPVRAGDRRAALMAVSTRPAQIPFSLIATLAGDQGYRTVTLLPVRHDLEAAGTEKASLDLRSHDAVISAGGNSAVTDWPLPLATPGLEFEQDALVADWNRRTEGKLEDVLVGRLTAAIRTWRPEVLVLDEPAADDAAGRLVFEAGRLAMQRAADATRYVEQRPALVPWSVKKAYVRLRSGDPADAAIERGAVLSRLGQTTADVADAAGAHLAAFEATTALRDTYRLIPLDASQPAPAGPFFGGLAIAAGSAARRDVGPPPDDRRAVLIANRERMLRAYMEHNFDDARQAAGVLAQLDELSAGMSPAQAARNLHRIADAHRARSQWDLAEQTFIALIERYPDEPPSRDAMTWLLRLWTGAEPVWRRMENQGTETTFGAGSVATLASRIDRAFRMAADGTAAATAEDITAAGLAADPLAVSTAGGAIKIDARSRWDDATVAHWRQQAVRLGGLIRKTDPALFITPQVQFPLATAIRTGGGSSAAYLQRLAAEGQAGGWQPKTAAELTLTQTGDERQAAAAVSQRALEPPHLDGVFADPCWQNAKELPLASDSSGMMPDGSIAFVAHDDQFLYLAVSVARVPGRPVPQIELAGRTHDAALQGRDRLVLLLDVDRDYATCYRFGIDHRGQTAEDCWGDATWNPQWYVAADGDDERWRIELAIPFSELGPRPPHAGALWAISLCRICPAVGVQGWPRPGDGTPHPEAFGLMRFE